MSDERPKALTSELTYEVGFHMDVLHLGELVEQWHSLICQSMPGTEIESITYARPDHRLVVTFK